MSESTRVDSARRAEKPLHATSHKLLTEDEALRDELSEKLSGDAFERAMLAAYEGGAPDDSSYDLCRKLAFLCSAAGIAKVEGERVVRAFFELPQHRATHCQTDAGRRQLLAQFRSCARHQQRNVDAGHVEPGKLARSALWKMLHELLGRRPRLRVVPTVTKAKLSDTRRRAAQVRWSRRVA